MKAIIKSDLLNKSLKQMSPVIRKNVVLPITSGVLFQFKKDICTIVGTDLETIFIANIPCDCDDEFFFAVDYGRISDVCSKISTPLVLNFKDNTLLINDGGRYKVTLSVLDGAEHFPKVPTDAYIFSVNVGADFFNSLYKANTCKHTDENMVLMNSACVDFKKEQINLVGTNMALAYIKTLQVKCPHECTCKVGDNFVQLTKQFGDAVISVGEKFIKAEYNGMTVVSRLKEQAYVPYSTVFSIEKKYNLTVNRQELISTLDKISPAFGLTKVTDVYFKDGEIIFKSVNPDLGNEAEYDIEVEHEVNFDAICLNGGQFLHLLNLIDSDKVDLDFRSHDKTVFIKSSNDESLLCLVQPLLLQTSN